MRVFCVKPNCPKTHGNCVGIAIRTDNPEINSYINHPERYFWLTVNISGSGQVLKPDGFQQHEGRG
jgi:hypothetical protein